MSNKQEVYLSKSKSGKCGFFTGNFLSHPLTDAEFEVLSNDPAKAKAKAQQLNYVLVNKTQESSLMLDLLKSQQVIAQQQLSIVEQLKADREQTIAAYDLLITSAEQSQQIDEGLFTNLKATLATLGHLTGASAKKVADIAKKVTADVKEVYVSNKAKAELEQLVKSVKKVIADFEVIEKDSSTIIKRDPEVAKEMELFATLLNKLLGTLSVRMAMSTGANQTPAAEKTDMRDLK